MSIPIIRTLFSLVLLLGLNVSLAGGNEPEPSELTLTTERVVVFKDGYCLIVKQGTAKTDADGRVHTTQVPDSAILGSFWAIPEKGTIKSMTAGWVDVESSKNRTQNCKTIIEIIQANLGQKCSFVIGDGEKFEGTILKVLSNDQADTEDTAAAQRRQLLASLQGSPTPMGRASETISFSQTSGSFFVLKTERGEMMVAVNGVKNLTIDGMKSTWEQTVTKKSRHKQITLDFGTPNQDVKISWMYFRPGVRWIPTYRIGLTERPFQPTGKYAQASKTTQPKIAEVAMQGEILNEAEDLIDVPFHVVVGVPNFRFRSVPSPMTLESSVRNVLAQAVPNISGNQFSNMSNALYTQRSSEFRSNRATGNSARSDVNLPEELTGSGGNDLFVYELPKMTLRKGDRATVPILKTEVPYRDVYTWEINVTHSETYSTSSYAPTTSGSSSPLTLTKNRIWRQVELINNTDLPWTTGAAMFMDGFQPLAQELLTYTSPGGICRVPVTVSVDLRGKVEDVEVSRKLNALRWRSHDYARIVGRADVELANNKKVPVAVEVTLRFGGKATQASDDGKISLESYRQEDWSNHVGNPINTSSTVRWETTIIPGECFKPIVDYEFLLRY